MSSNPSIVTPYQAVGAPDDLSYLGIGAPLTQEFANPNPSLQPEGLPEEDQLSGLWITLSVLGGLILLAGIIFIIFWFTRPGDDARTLSTEALSTPDETTTGPQVWLKDVNQSYVEFTTTGAPITATQSTTQPTTNGFTFVRGSTFDNEYKDILTGPTDAQVPKYPNADALGMFCWVRNDQDQWLDIGSSIGEIPVMTICNTSDPNDCLSMSNGFVFQSFGTFDGTALNLTTTPGKHIFVARDARATRPDPETDRGMYRVLVYDTSASRWKIFTYYIPDVTNNDPYPLVDGVDLNTGADDILDWATTDNATYAVPGDVSGYTTELAAQVNKFPIVLSDTQPATAPFRVNPVGIRTFFWETNTTTRLSVQNDLATFQMISAVEADPLIWLVEPINEDELAKLFDGQDRYKESWLAGLGAFDPYSAPTSAT